MRQPVLLVLRKGAALAALRGHPWVWREGIVGDLGGVRAGDEVKFAAADGRVIARGLADPGSPIAARVWTLRPEQAVNAALLQARTRRAAEVRARMIDADTTAYRLVHGEGDRMPGLVADRYGTHVVVRTDGEAAAARVGDFADALRRACGEVTSIVHKARERVDVLYGRPPPAALTVTEHGVPMVVDVVHGQKTGAFLDQRENRRRVGQLSRGRGRSADRVLNLFSYTGGFSLHAALGGARHVTSVDVATAAHATAQASFRAAGVDPGAHAFVTADVKQFLAQARARGETWDLVVSDPPSFAPSERALARAIGAYRALHRACAQVLAPGGILCASSCSSHVDAAAFLSTLDDASLGRDDLRVMELHGAGPDHPSLAAFPEGRYLKFAVLA